MSNLGMSQSSGNETLDFFNEIYRGALKGNVVLWVKQSGKSTNFHVSDLAKASSKALELSAGGVDLYSGRGLQAEPQGGSKRGKQNEVIFVSGPFADIDFASGEHSAEASTLPVDTAEALKLIQEAGLPPPTMIVFTGGGIHCYWSFTDPVMIETAEDRAVAKALSAAWQARLRRTFAVHGYILDATQDLSRVVRVPGTVNRKNGGAVPVRIVSRGERIDRAAAIDLVMGDMEAPPEAAGSDMAKGILTAAAATSLKGPTSVPEAAPMILGCAFVRYCIDNAATLTEPWWYAYLSLIGFCENGHEIAHETSCAHPGYSPEATDAKLMQAVTAAKPMVCAHAAKALGFEGCKTCPFYGIINSPIALGYQDTAIVAAQIDMIYDIETDRYYMPSNGDKMNPTGAVALHRARIGKDPLDQLKASKTMPMVRRLDYLVADTRMMIPSEAGKPVLNMWKPAGVVPAAGDAGPILGHFDYLFPKQEEREHVLNYLACMLQRPAEKIAHALMICGVQGNGKSTIGYIVQKLVGARNFQEVSGDEMGDKWTTRMVQVQALAIEEAAHGGKYEVYNRYKVLFTGEFFGVQGKGIAPYDGRTPRGIFLFANHDAPLAVTNDDRRFHVSETVNPPASSEYFTALYAALDGATIPAFATWLLARDISAFNHKQPPPMTEAKVRAQEASLTPTADILKTIILAGGHPFHREVMTVEEVHSALIHSRYIPANQVLRPGKVSAAMKDLGGVRLNDGIAVRLPNQMKVRLWAMQNGASWAGKPLDEIKAEYLRVPGGENVHRLHGRKTDQEEVVYPHRTFTDYLQGAGLGDLVRFV